MSSIPRGIRIDRGDYLWPKPCVYALIKEGQIQYIGQTVNLPSRLRGHAFGKYSNQYWWDEVIYYRVPHHLLGPVEYYLIAQLQPPYNRRPSDSFKSELFWASPRRINLEEL